MTPRGQVWQHGPAVAEVASKDRVALLSMDELDAAPVLLTDTAAAIWQAIDGRRGLDEIVAATAAAFGADATSVAAGVESFVGDLSERGLVIPAQPGPRS